MICPECKKKFSERAVGENSVHREFFVQMNLALIELQLAGEDALPLLNMAVIPIYEKFSKANKKPLKEFMNNCVTIHEKMNEARR